MARTPPLHFLEYWALSGVTRGLAVLPHTAALKLGAAMGSTAFSVLKIRRHVMEANAATALELPPQGEALRDLGARCYRNLGMTLVELARLRRLGRFIRAVI